MKELTCKDMGIMECDFVAKGETEDEVTQSMMDHAKQAHPEKMGAMPEEEMRNMMKSKVKDGTVDEIPGQPTE